MIKFAIVEDDARFCKSLRRVVESNPEYTCDAIYPNGRQALEGIPARVPDMVIMDLNLPDMAGADVTAQLKSEMPDLRIIILTVYNDSENIFRALRAGASGYLLKQATAQEILDAIAEVYRGGAPMTSEIARKVIATFHEPSNQTQNAVGTLSPREKEILDLLAQGYANKEIADKLGITVGTTCWYLHGIYRKLHVQSRVQAINKLRSKTA
jgi:DNA-binding NarL/FixJ family response regulator